MNAAQHVADYQSDFDFETSSEASGGDSLTTHDAGPSPKKKRRRSSPAISSSATASSAVGVGGGVGGGAAATSEAASRQEAAVRRQRLVSMDAYSRHKQLVNDYIRYYGGSYADLRRDDSNDRRDWDIVREHHRFVWDEDGEEGEEESGSRSWEQRLAKRYWDKLFKEYCLADLRKYKDGRIGMRWRTKQEVVAGRGQFSCGSKRCLAADGLTSWEVNFAYVEAGQRRNALVKLRLCDSCSRRLNYRKRHKQRSAPAASAAAAEQAATAAEDSDVAEQLRAIRQESQQQQQQQQSTEEEVQASGDEIWRRPPAVEDEEANREEEFDKYFADMLL